MGHLVVPLKAVMPFWGQAANHPLPGDLAYADGSVIVAANQAIVNGSSYTLPDLRNKHVIGADRTLAAGEPGQYISFVSTASGAGYNYQYTDQWGNGTYTIGSTDYLIYDVFWPSANLPASGNGPAVDLYFTDATYLRGATGANDQNGIASHPNSNLRTYALDQWYTRRIPLSGVASKVFSSILLAVDNPTSISFTNLTGRIRNIYIGDSTGNIVRMPLWMAGDGTPNYVAYSISNYTFVSGNASTLTAPGPDGIGGTNKFTMKGRHLPVHNHTGSTASTGDHTHSTSITGHSSHAHSFGGNVSLVTGTHLQNSGTHTTVGCVTTTQSTGSHTHTVSPGADGAHEHTVTVNASTSGLSTPIDTRPRYLGVVWTVKSGLPTARLLSIPMGSIITWYADTINETLPAGFSFTDGSTIASGSHIVPNQSGSTAYTLTLPDTRNRYLIGCDRTKAFGTAGTSASDLPTDAPGPGATGGTHVATVTAGNLPSHVHGSASTSGNPWAAHNHSWSVTANGDHSHAAPQYNFGSANAAGGEVYPGGSLIDDVYQNDTTVSITSTSTNDSHSHTFSIGFTSIGNHSHTITINNNGSGTSWDGRIPFIGVVYLMRTNIGLLSTPLKTIIGFRSTVANEALVPTDGTWAACDGSTLTAGNFDMAANSGGNYVLPDFRKFFPLGADRTKAAGNAGGTTDTAADAPGPKGTAGTDSITVTTSIMAAHNHPAVCSAAGDHDHGTSVGTSANGGHAHGTGCQTYFTTATLSVALHFSTSGTFSPPAPATVTTGTAAATQPAHGTSCSTAGAHTHTVNVNNAGSGSAMHQRPRHHGLVFYMKVKR